MRFSAATMAERVLPERLAARARPLAEQIDAILFPSDGRGQAGRASLITFVLRIANAFLALVSQILLARYMGAFEYGIFVLVWVVMTTVGSLACLGFDISIIRFVPEYRAKQNFSELRGVLLASRRVSLLSSIIVMILGLLGIYFLQSFIEDYYILPFAIGLLALPMVALNNQYDGVARANSWAVRAMAPIFLFRPTVILIIVLGMYFAGYEPDARAAVIAAVVAAYLTALVQYLTIGRKETEGIEEARPSFRLREWWLISLPIFLVDGFFFLLTNADVLILGFFVSPEEVGVYYAVVKTLALAHFAYYAVAVGVGPRYSTLIHSGEDAALRRFARETVSWTFWPSVASGVIVLLLGKPILMLFGTEFAAGYPLVFVLLVGVIMRAGIGPAEKLLTMSGNQNACLAAYGTALIVNITLNIILIPLMGLWGAALATTIATLFEAVLLALTVWRKFGIVMVVFWPTAPEKEAI